MSAPAPGQTAAAGAEIEAALHEVARHLEARDPLAAATAVERLGAACAAAARVGLDDVTRARLQPLVARCTALASETSTALTASLARLGTGSRAHRAYNTD
ncbi:MAG TPA: hypothetical protein VFH68_23390 [Polyangia bacterium]|nr:hypothetical protein [Polyangia bacterium]